MKQQPTTPTSKKQDKATAEVIKIGIDIHKSKYVVVCQLDGETPKAPQSFVPEAFFAWVAERIKHVGEAYSCYEAGCFGYVAHRRLEALGVTNFVVRPRNWDEYGSKVKTDQGERGSALSRRKRVSS